MQVSVFRFQVSGCGFRLFLKPDTRHLTPAMEASR